MFTDKNGNIYAGEMRFGDREATQAEIDAWNLARQPALQQRIDAYVSTQTQGQIQNELQLEGLMAGLLGAQLGSGGTEADLVLRNSAYRLGKQLRAAIAAMRAAV